MEALINDDNMGLLFLNSKVRYGNIFDGSTNTILIGEMLPTSSSLGWASGTNASLRNTGHIIESGGSRFDSMADFDPNFVSGFGSHHAGGVQFALADGAIKFLTQSIDPEYFQNLGNRADRAMVGDDRR